MYGVLPAGLTILVRMEVDAVSYSKVHQVDAVLTTECAPDFVDLLLPIGTFGLLEVKQASAV